MKRLYTNTYMLLLITLSTGCHKKLADSASDKGCCLTIYDGPAATEDNIDAFINQWKKDFECCQHSDNYYMRGISLYKTKISYTKNSAEYKAYVDTLLNVYDRYLIMIKKK